MNEKMGWKGAKYAQIWGSIPNLTLHANLASLEDSSMFCEFQTMTVNELMSDWNKRRGKKLSQSNFKHRNTETLTIIGGFHVYMKLDMSSYPLFAPTEVKVPVLTPTAYISFYSPQVLCLDPMLAALHCFGPTAPLEGVSLFVAAV